MERKWLHTHRPRMEKHSMKSKRAMSGVVIAIIMIALALFLGSVVWGVVNNLVKGEIGKSSSCFGIYEKISIERRYTCFDSTNNITRIQIRIGDIDIDNLLVSISGNTKSKYFTLTNEYQTIENLVNYSSPGAVKLPRKNSGITYNFSWGPEDSPNLIRIAPTINKNQCETVDTLAGIDDCSILV